MSIDIDNIIDKIIESLDFEENSYLGNKLGVDTDFSCVLDDMYPDRIAEMEEELGEALHNLFEGNLDKPITEHPDVQRLIGQVAELQIKSHELQDENERLKTQDAHVNGLNKVMVNNAQKHLNENERLRSVIHDVIILTEETSTKEFAEQALKGNER